jgi:hypothetical protein
VRIIVEVLGRTLVLQFAQGRTAQPEQEEEFSRAPVDPHSVGGGQFEQSQQEGTEVQEFSGAGVYPVPSGHPPFGFGHGS